MNLTVILCTYNRCGELPRALESVAFQTLPHSVEWEVLVVDNNSSDQTRAVVEDFCLRHPGRFRYLFEPQQGLSYARNAGVREARGKILAFTDDDVIAEPGWLQNLTAGLHSGEWAGAGGRVLPRWPCSPPPWVPVRERFGLAPIAMFDLGSQVISLSEAPVGANMAFERGMFEKYGGFRTDLGRCGDKSLSNEDTEFGRRLLAAGERLRYEPSAVVNHSVPQERLRQHYFLKFWFDKGRSDILEFGIPRDTRWRVAEIPIDLFRRITRWTAQWTLSIKPSKRFHRKSSVWYIAGQIFQCYRQSPRAKGTKPSYRQVLRGS